MNAFRLTNNFLLYLICCGLLSCSGNSVQRAGATASVAPTTGICGIPVGPVLASVDALPVPTLRSGMGNSEMKITTNSADAQKWFNYGINLLHDFWHLEAYRAFSQVVKADSTCAMGWWGIAMCQPGFSGSEMKVWQQAISKAEGMKPRLSEVEKDLIDATSYLVAGGIHDARTVKAFRDIVVKYPDDPEPLAFASIVIRQNVTYGDRSSDEAKALLEKALKKFPEHTGLLHYYVHVMEVRPDFIKVKAFAEKMKTLAPNATHIQHMPGHIYFLEGDYAGAVKVFEEAREQEKAWHAAEKIPFAADQNYMHNLHYLAVAYSELGEKEKALEAAEAYSSITLNQDVIAESSALMLLYEGRILPALVHIRFGEYDKAAEKIEFWLNSVDFPLTNPLVKTYLQVMRNYALAMAAVKKGDIEQATHLGSQLSQLMKVFEKAGLEKINTTEGKTINETFDIMSMARYELAGWIDNMDKTHPFNEAAWKEAIDLQNLIKYDEPPRLMYPIEESQARLHQYRGETTAASKAVIQALKRRPRSAIIHQIAQ